MGQTQDKAPGTYIEQAITDFWGERCDPIDDDCPTCQAWAEFDALSQAYERGQVDMRERLRPAAVYFERYCQDEAEDVENCVCGKQQHEDAKAFETAIRSLPIDSGKDT